jgi:hypothetical protein
MRRAALLAVVLAVLLAAAGAQFLALSAEPLLAEFRTRVAALVGDRLGRRVDLGPIRLAWRGGPGAEATGMTVAGPPGAEAPQVTVGSAFFRLDVWTLVRTRGRRLEVREVVLRDPVLRAERNRTGAWDVQDVVDRLWGPQDGDPAGDGVPRRWAADRVVVEGGRVHVVDRQTGQRLVLDQVRLRVDALVPGQDVTADLDMVLDDLNNRSPLALRVRVKSYPAVWDVTKLPALDVRLALAEVEVGPWAWLLPPGVVHPRKGRLAADLRVEVERAAAGGRVKGAVRAQGLVLARGTTAGRPADVRMDVDLEVASRSGRVEVRRLDVTGAGASVTTRLKVVGRGLAGLREAQVDVKVEDLSSVLAVAPAGLGLLPDGLVLAGPLQATLTGDVQRTSLVVDLDRARIAFLDVVDKPAGVPLRLDVVSTRAQGLVRLDPVRVAVADARLAGRVDVPLEEGRAWEGVIQSGQVALEDLRALFPSAAGARRRGLGGVLRLSAQARGTVQGQALEARVSGHDLEVDLPRAGLRGNAELALGLNPSALGAGLLEATLDATDLGARLQGAGGAVVLDKVQGVALQATISASHTPERVTVKRAALRLADSTALLSGRVDGWDTGAPTLDFRAEGLKVLLDNVRALVPGASRLPAGGVVMGRLVVTGTLGDASTTTVRLEDAVVTAGKSRLEGSVAVVGQEEPFVDVNLPVVDMDLEDAHAWFALGALPRQGRARASLVVTGRPSRPSTLAVVAERLDARAWGTRVTGRVDVRDLESPRVDAQVAVDRVSIDAVLGEVERARGPRAVAPARQGPPARALPQETRAWARGVAGSLHLTAGEARYQAYTARDVTVRASLEGAVLKVEQLDLSAYRGVVSLGGTSVDLDADPLETRLTAYLREVDLGELYDAHARGRGRVAGNVDADIRVTARGASAEEVLATLEGPVAFSTPELKLKGTNLLEEVLRPLARSPLVPALVRQSIPTERRDLEPATTLEAVDLQGRVQRGRLVLSRPLTVSAAFGTVRLLGGVGADARLDLVGTAALHPQVVWEMTRGRREPPQDVVVPLRVGGTWNDPTLDAVDLSSLLPALGLGSLRGRVGDADEATRRGMVADARRARAEADLLRDLAVADARARADEEGRAAEALQEAAQDLADQAPGTAGPGDRRQAAEAQRRAVEARRVADQARAQAEALAREQTEERRRREEEAARQRWEEARARAAALEEAETARAPAKKPAPRTAAQPTKSPDDVKAGPRNRGKGKR